MKRLLALFLLLGTLLFAQQTQENSQGQEAKNTENEALAYIPIGEVPEASAKISLELEKIIGRLDKKSRAQEISHSLEQRLKQLYPLLYDPAYEYLKSLNLKYIEKRYSELSNALVELQEWGKGLDAEIESYSEILLQLKDYSKLWSETLVEATKEQAPPALVQSIIDIVTKIESIRMKVKLHFNEMLDARTTITNTSLQIKKLLEDLSEAKQNRSRQLFEKNDIGYVQQFWRSQFHFGEYLANIAISYKENFKEFLNYIEVHSKQLPYFFFFVFAVSVFVGYFYYLYRKNRLFIYEESIRNKTFGFIKRPVSTAIILVALVDTFLFDDMPQVVADTHLLFVLIPIFRVVQTVLPQRALRYIYTFFTLYALFLVHESSGSVSFDARSVALLLGMALLGYLFVVIKQDLIAVLIQGRFKKSAKRALYFLEALLLFSILANLYGATLLANRLLEAVFGMLYASILFFTLTLILSGYTIIILRRHMAKAPNLVEEFVKKVEYNTVFAIKMVMGVWWGVVILRQLGIYPYLREITLSFLSISWQISNITISIQALFDFAVIIVLTWFLTKFLNAVLEVEVFSRYSFPRGVPTAIKTVLNYTIIIVGIIVALSALGISSQQFALVFGALGVGIGFGLRNIIANFVSGIIMVFERPVQIGDTIQVDNTLGKVKSIGARSTTVKTFDGSEVIIPNADFISKEITNWTLSDERRRKTLLFKVDFGNDIQKVLDIMYKVALRHPDVLKDPEPLATFNGFGEYYLEFKLYFWLTENLIVAQSEIAIAVYEALKEAGVNMPVPKQEIELKREDSSR